MTFWCGSGYDFKMQNFFSSNFFLIAYPAPGTLSSSLIYCFKAKFCVKMLFCKHYFSPLYEKKGRIRTRIREAQKHADPDPQNCFSGNNKNSSWLTLVRSTLSGRPRHSSWSSLFALLILIWKQNKPLLSLSMLGSSSLWSERAKNFLKDIDQWEKRRVKFGVMVSR